MGNTASATPAPASGLHGRFAAAQAGKPSMGSSATLPARGRTSGHHHHHSPHLHHQQHQHHPNCQSTLGGRSRKSRGSKSGKAPADAAGGGGGAESSRVLFLLYLINRTWNVVVDSVDPKSKRARSCRSQSEDSGAACSYLDDDGGFDTESAEVDFEDADVEDDEDELSLYGTQCTMCSCSHCTEEQPKRNPIFGRNELRMSFSESELSYSVGDEMAPSSSKTPPGTQMGAPKMSASDFAMGSSTHLSNSNSASAASTKDNQRPPVYNAEDYVQSLKKYSRRAGGSGGGGSGGSSGSMGTMRSIYDTSDNGTVEPGTLGSSNGKDEKEKRSGSSSTLPSKHSDYKSPIPSPPANECEMSLRQFGSITDLLTKLRADLRASFPSFVQELVASPMDGVSLLLEVLRAIQLSQSGNASGGQTPTAAAQRNNQSYQRRALLDELACLQCINLCTTRCPDAALRLGTSPVGLMPLAAAATGQGIRSRILGLQLLTAACDRHLLAAAHSTGGTGHSSGSAGGVRSHPGHNSVSEALSTLRLRCGEPVRFRLLVGMMNSGGGSGELQLHGLKFVNTFLASAENSQNRLYLQAELYQAGFDPLNMANTITESSPWLEKLHAEVRYFQEHKIDVEALLVQNREAERIRSQMVVLERRVQILHEEKTVLTSMERRLQERCADLQREVFRLQGAHHQDTYKTLDSKRPVALPRHVPPPPFQAQQQQQQSGGGHVKHLHRGSELDDEGISSSETGQSMSPEPCLVLPMGNSQKYRITVTSEDTVASGGSSSSTANGGVGAGAGGMGNHKSKNQRHTMAAADDDDTAVTIDEVIEELANIVSDAEREIRGIAAPVAAMPATKLTYPSVSGGTGNGLTETAEADRIEKDIVPVNLLPQPPRKSRSLVHLLSHRGSEDFDPCGSEYGMLGMGNGVAGTGPVGIDDLHYDHERQKFGRIVANGGSGGANLTADLEPPMLGPDVVNQSSTNREILNVIMDAREKDGGMDGLILMQMQAEGVQQQMQQMQQQQQQHQTQMPTEGSQENATTIPVPAHKFHGVFFMAEMNTPQKYPKPDITAALEARRVTKNLDRIESYGSGGLDSMIDIVMTETAQKRQQQMQLQAPSILVTGAAKQSRFGATGGGSAMLMAKGQQGNGNRMQQTAATNGGADRLSGGSKITDLASGLY